MTRLIICVVALILLLTAIASSQRRDSSPIQPRPTGTAVISGVTQSPGDDRAPVPRAIVTVASGLVVRSTLSDDAGRFSIPNLSAGTYTVTVRKPGWLPAEHGATRPGGSGVPVVVAEAAQVEAPVTIFKGAAVAGVLRDSLGEPVSDVAVMAINVRTGNQAPATALPESTNSDVRGEFRIFGLPPGEYVIAAVPATTAARSLTGNLSTSEIESALGALAARGAAAVSDDAAVLPQSRAMHYAPVFFPGTPYVDRAERVTLASGNVREDINIEVTPTIAGSIAGTLRVTAADRPSLRIDVFPSYGVVSSVPSTRRVTTGESDGRFVFQNLAPGRYRVVARANPGGASRLETMTTQAGGGATVTVTRETSPVTSSGTFVYASADVEVRGDERTQVELALQPGGTLSGRIRIDSSTAGKLDLQRIRLGVQLDESESPSMHAASNLFTQAVSDVQAGGRFELRGLAPGRFRLIVTAPATPTGRWHARSAMAGSRDLLDEALDLGPGIAIPDVVITMSDRPSGVDGTLQSSTGQPTAAVNVIILPVDRQLWRAGPRRIAAMRPQTDGRFAFDVPPGDYALAAVMDVDSLDLENPDWLEQIAGAGVKVTIAERTRTKQDLRIK